MSGLISSISTSAVYGDRKSTRLNSSHGYISYAVFCLKKKKHDVPLGTPSSMESENTLLATHVWGQRAISSIVCTTPDMVSAGPIFCRRTAADKEQTD